MIDDSPRSLAVTDLAPQGAAARPDPVNGQGSPRHPGEVIAGKYRLDRYLARGGMAEVWLATHVSLKTAVAIKFVSVALVRDRSSGPYALERFRFEAQISARLGALSRHVVAVHDAGVHQEIPYLVMEYVPGHTLEAEVERGLVAPDRFAEILDQIADALAAAHALGIVHRDLKPSNVMLVDAPDGGLLVKVADFGVAKAFRGDLSVDKPRETTAGELVGSPAFMSPEQVRGLGAVDARCDVWALGVIAYEVLTGRPCFEGQSVADMITSILMTEPPRPSQIRPELPRGIDRWVERALAEDFDRRFASVTEMADAFRRAIGPGRARRMWPLVAGVVFAATALLAVALILRRATATHEERMPVSMPPPASAAPAQAAPSAPASVPTAEQTGRPAATSPPEPPKRVARPKVATAIAPVIPTTTTAAPPPPPQPLPAPAPAPAKKVIDPSEIQ